MCDDTSGPDLPKEAEANEESLSLVLQGNPDNFLNTVVGAVLFTLLASQHRYYHPSTA